MKNLFSKTNAKSLQDVLISRLTVALPSNKSLHMASLIGAIVRACDHASDDETLCYSISLLLREFKNLSYPDGFLVRGLCRANTARNDEMFLAIGSFSAVVKNLG